MWAVLALSVSIMTAAATELRDVEFARPGGVRLTLDAWIPESASPQRAVILVHGGGWEAGDKRTYIRPWFDELTKQGLAWFTINYRLAPKHPHPAAVEDVEAAVEWVRANSARLGIDPQRLALMGESAGGHLVALAAARGKAKVKCAVSFYGIHDIPLWAQQRGALPKNIAQYLAGADPASASPIRFITPQTPPMLFIHGTADKGVPFEQSRVMCDALQRVRVPCQVRLIEGAPHGVENWEGQPVFQAWRSTLAAWFAGRL